jgi:Transposase zinc-binding domain
MSRPSLEVADVIRAAGDSFFDRSRDWFSWRHQKVLDAILACRTPALGGHVDECANCGYRTISFNSCLMGSFF